MECNESKELLGLYVTGSLTPAEAREMDRHLRSCPACAAERREVETTLAMLPFALEGPEPPARVRQALVDRLKEDSAPSAPSNVQRTFGLLFRPAFSFAFLALSLILLGGVVYEQRRFSRELAAANAEAEALRSQIEATRNQLAMIQSPATTMLTLKGQAPSPRSSGMVYWNRTQAVWMVSAWHLPAPPPGKAYELWFLTHGAPVKAGMLSCDEAGNAFAEVSIPGGVFPTNAAVSLEPAQGVDAPTGAIYLVSSS
ncbi:MAG: anti-sigma factor [Acidobacteriia bacterium]|nr:anti-sigma factor [Terriglobia bacterium]